jgi:hypothetical protein
MASHVAEEDAARPTVGVCDIHHNYSQNIGIRWCYIYSHVYWTFTINTTSVTIKFPEPKRIDPHRRLCLFTAVQTQNA